MFVLSLSYIPSYVHVHPGYREKSDNSQGMLKLHIQFYNVMLRLHRPHNDNWHAHYSLRAHSMPINTSVSREIYERFGYMRSDC